MEPFKMLLDAIVAIDVNETFSAMKLNVYRVLGWIPDIFIFIFIFIDKKSK